MYDLTDSDGGDAGASEPRVQTLGERVTATIRDCRHRLNSGSTTRIRGAFNHVYCAELAVDPAVGTAFFQTRASIRAQVVTRNATITSHWPQSAIGSVWRKNSYGFD